MTSNLKQFKKSLKEDHVIYTMITEHELILGFLDELDDLNHELQKNENYKSAEAIINNIKMAINIIIDAEPHHQREERVLFTELEKRGVMGPPKIMRWEHHELRQFKHEIKELVINANNENFEIVKRGLNSTIFDLVNNLRDHILKENTILYPMAIDVIPDNKKWEEMKKECDNIGYCSFTPPLLSTK